MIVLKNNLRMAKLFFLGDSTSTLSFTKNWASLARLHSLKGLRFQSLMFYREPIIFHYIRVYYNRRSRSSTLTRLGAVILVLLGLSGELYDMEDGNTSFTIPSVLKIVNRFSNTCTPTRKHWFTAVLC